MQLDLAANNIMNLVRSGHWVMFASAMVGRWGQVGALGHVRERYGRSVGRVASDPEIWTYDQLMSYVQVSNFRRNCI